MRAEGSDFRSALYLGSRHPTTQLEPWSAITQGAPACLKPSPGSAALAARLAKRIGVEAATLGTSTLHLFWDLFGMLPGQPVRILMDAGLYPVGQWGIERARALGVPVESYRHQDPESLKALLGRGGPTPIVVTDGFCTGCGRIAPLDVYLALLRNQEGWLLLDDSQALGLLGLAPSPFRPYGSGGGGSPHYLGVHSRHLITLSSLAKGWGAPIAVLAGCKTIITRFEMRSETRVHSSPPSNASLRAAEHALTVEADRGEALRARLATRVRRLRGRLWGAGIALSGGLFPVQNVRSAGGTDLTAVHDRLRAEGFRTLLRKPQCQPEPVLTLIIRADHTLRAIDRVAEALARSFACPSAHRTWADAP